MRKLKGRKPPISHPYVKDRLIRIAAVLGGMLFAGVSARAEAILGSPALRNRGRVRPCPADQPLR